MLDPTGRRIGKLLFILRTCADRGRLNRKPERRTFSTTARGQRQRERGERVEGKLVLVTGAAGTGKSTLVRSILSQRQAFERIDYGELLLDHKERQCGIRMTYDQLRRNSATAITPDDVRAVDEWLIGQLPSWRTKTNLLMDSHPVTKEEFGFRVTPFSLEQIQQIKFDVIIVLVGEPQQLAERIQREPLGRPSVDAFQAGFQVHLQAALAAFYAVACGRPCFALDTTRLDAAEIAAVAVRLIDGAGFPRDPPKTS